MKLLLSLLLIVSCHLERSPASSTRSCLQLFKLLTQRYAAGVSVEIETSFANGMLMPLLTTEDGTVGALFRNNSLPAYFVEAFPQKPEQVLWDSLPYHHKIKLLNAVGEKRTTSFERDRIIHGLIIKPKMNFDFKESGSFMGNAYPPGRHSIPIGSYFGPVEYGSSKDLSNLRGLELHLRGNVKAGEMIESARSFITFSKLDVPNLHMHTVAQIPFDKLASDPLETSVALANLYRRSDLASEILDIIFAKNSLGIAREGNIVFQDTSKPHFISGIANYFYQISEGKIANLENAYKKGWAGFHGSGKYDNPDFWGMQFRQMLKEHSTDHLISLINATQKRMNDQLDQEVQLIKKWMTQNNLSPRTLESLNQLHYNHNWDIIIDSASKEIRELVSNQDLLEKLKMIANENSSIKMLVHDWSKDPLFWNNPSIKKRILEKQLSALKQISTFENVTGYRGHSLIVEVMTNFLLESQMAKKIFDSLGASEIL